MTAEAYGIAAGSITWREAAAEVERLRAAYAAAGYGHGHRVGLLLENRPAFLFHWFALNAIGFFGASQMAASLGERFGMARTIRNAVAAFAAITAALLVLTLLGFGTLPVIIAMLFAGNAFLGLVMPTTMVMALDPHPDIAGLASSLGGTLQMLTGGAMIALAGPFFDGTATPMVAAIALAGALAFVAARLTFRDPQSFAVTGGVDVTVAGVRADRLNELECVEGAVYANVWRDQEIFRIDPDDGRVTAVIDASGLLSAKERLPADVLNGIAHRPETGTFFVTGKLWPKLFEVVFEGGSARGG